ncbi:MAG: chitobiase/beta-hexosaminidase C-terminal domain-containing protein [Clostridia bacterium]|nr:chitobiase/beta-hexosaminidase C-terminal domain-containing protein [Clostridia bacterium]
MLCPYCETYADPESLVCPGCGKMLPRREKTGSGVMSIRQGRPDRREPAQSGMPMAEGRQGMGKAYFDDSIQDEAPDENMYIDESRIQRMERRESASYSDTAENDERIPVVPQEKPGSQRRKKKLLRNHMTNWMAVLVVAGVLLFVLLAGTVIFLQRTERGQMILARMGRDAGATAYWSVGEERMDTGDVEGAIADFVHARELDAEKEETNVAGLLLLASCYESVGDFSEAENIYVYLYTDVVPSAADAYSNEIRILQNTGREDEAAELMLLAYERTGNSNFTRQRNELLPAAPVTSLGAGLYEEKKYVSLTSPEQDEIYYTFSADSVLPEEGIQYTEPIFLDEGIWSMRAVSVRGKLVSDELTAVYRIIMPSPQSPYAMLAPGTYQKRQRVKLRVGDENKDDDDITIYYTIDGSIPDADSPIYDGEGVLLPGGNSVLHAVAVNGYGKASNTLERGYKVEQKPWPEKSYTVEDTANGIVLNATTWDTFRAAYGEGESMELVSMEGLGDNCQKHNYSWGFVTFYLDDANRQFLCEMYFDQPVFKGPRGTAIGDTENGVVSQFRDMGQVESPSGNRGLYSNDYGRGKIYVEDGGKRIRYIHNTADSHKWQLDYVLSSAGVVVSIDQRYIP